MSKESLYICDCGSTVLAISHTWQEMANLEEVGFVKADGQYVFDEKSESDREEQNHEWVAYCGGCGKGVTVEWLSEGRVRLLLDEK